MGDLVQYHRLQLLPSKELSVGDNECGTKESENKGRMRPGADADRGDSSNAEPGADIDLGAQLARDDSRRDQIFSICSRLFPLVSGTTIETKITVTTQKNA